MKNNSNKHITKYLDYYISLKTPPEFAILLRGNWGCGKTWFIKDYLKAKEKKSYKFLYVSLYGVTTYKEIEDIIFEQLHPVLASKGMKLAGTVLKSLIKYTVKIDFDKNNPVDSELSPEVPTVDIPSFFKNIDERIVIFDDLERCSISTKDILGYINQFTENKLLKVIILSNEEEIIKSDRKNKENTSGEEKNHESYENFAYVKIKEKLIGKSFTVNPDLEGALLHFINDIHNREIKKLLKTSIDLIVDQYKCATYNNLRHLKQAILDFPRFYECIPDSAYSKPGLIVALMDSFLALTFEIKNGTITESEIPYIFGYPFNNPDKPKDKFQIIKSKYPIFNFNQHPFDLNIWTEYFINAGVNPTLIREHIENSPYYQNDRIPDWLKLWRYFDLEDSEFEELTIRLYKTFREKKLNEPYEVLHLASLFFFFSTNNLVDFKKDEILIKGKENLIKLKHKLKDFPKGLRFDSNSFGYQYHGLEIQEFQELLKFANEILDQESQMQLPKNAQIVLKSLTESLSEFQELLTVTRSGKNPYFDIPILKYLSSQEFADRLLKLKNKDIKYISDIFLQRYSFEDITKNLVEESDWMKKLKDDLLIRIKDKEHKLSGLRIKQFISTLDKCIDLLKKHNENNAG